MTDWIKWDGGECPIKSDKTRVEYEMRSGREMNGFARALRWSDTDSVGDIIAYRIIEDHEPKTTREEITAQIEALQKQLDAIPVVTRLYYDGDFTELYQLPYSTHYFDIETINGVPHINGVAMKEVEE